MGARRRIRRGPSRRSISCGPELSARLPTPIREQEPAARLVDLRGEKWLVTLVARIAAEDGDAGPAKRSGQEWLIVRLESLRSPHLAPRIARIPGGSLEELDEARLQAVLAAHSRGRGRSA
jgi:hypothetical protein